VSSNEALIIKPTATDGGKHIEPSHHTPTPIDPISAPTNGKNRADRDNPFA